MPRSQIRSSSVSGTLLMPTSKLPSSTRKSVSFIHEINLSFRLEEQIKIAKDNQKLLEKLSDIARGKKLGVQIHNEKQKFAPTRSAKIHLQKQEA